MAEPLPCKARKVEMPSRAQGANNPQKDLTRGGGGGGRRVYLTRLKGHRETLASRTAESKKAVCELPLICAAQFVQLKDSATVGLKA